MSDNETFIGLATIVVFGVGAQWIARRRDFPSLLLLLPLGLLAGGVFDLVKPEALFGETLIPGVTLLVGLLLFQSGLQLRLKNLPPLARRPVLRLTIIGAGITFAGGSLAVLYMIEPDAHLALVAGAILVVSGPTVVGPLLNSVRPREPIDAILSWEGTILDPLGAILGVVVLNLVLASGRVGLHPVLQMGFRLLLGGAVGLVAGALLVFVMSRFLVTDNMEAAVALLFAVGAFAVAEVLLSEAGLFAAVVLGVVAANQNVVPTSRISGFGETLEVLIIGSLFIVLGALIDVDDLIALWPQILGVVAILVLVVRPLAVAISMLHSEIHPRDRVLLAWVDPRGVVAAATAASFAGILATNGVNADFLLPLVFGVILGTGLIYSLTASWVASALGVRREPPTGVCLVGDDEWLPDLAACLQQVGVPVVVITASDAVRNPRIAATTSGRSRYSDRDEDLSEAISEVGVSKALVSLHAGMSEDLVTALLVERLGRRHVYRLLHSEETLVERSIEFAATALAFGRDITDEQIRSHLDRRRGDPSAGTRRGRRGLPAGSRGSERSRESPTPGRGPVRRRPAHRSGRSLTGSCPCSRATGDDTAMAGLRGCGWRPRQDSNLRTWLRRPLLYPLSYGGPGTGMVAGGRNPSGTGTLLAAWSNWLRRHDGAPVASPEP